MDLGLSGRTAIVCGASSGIGLAVAEALTREGANVSMFGRRRDLLEREAERLGALPVRGDLTNPKHLDALVAQTLDAFGGLDILILNGGGPPVASAVTMTVEQVETAFELLLAPHLRLVALALPHLRASAGGRIVAIEGTAVKEPVPNLALSNTVRAGVVGWLRTLARELGPDGVTVNTVAPGRIDTERLRSLAPNGYTDTELEPVSLRRIGAPAEIADVVCFLASERASYVTGTVVPVDGGLLQGT